MGKRLDIADEAGLYDLERARSDFDDVNRAAKDFDDVKRARSDFDDVNRAAKDFDDVKRAAKDFDDVKRARSDFDDVKRAQSDFDDVKRAQSDFDDVKRARSDFDDVKRAQSDFDDVKRAQSDFDDVKRARSDFGDVNRAARITDVDPAAHMVDQMLAAPWKSMTPDAALASFTEAASDASLATNKRSIYDIVSDQEFARMFKANGFAQRALLDESFIQLVVDPDFAMLINHKVASKIILDVDLASRLIEHGLMDRRQE